jgi:hypothetical protein
LFAPRIAKAKFCGLDDLIADQGDVAVVIDEHPDTPGQFYISAFRSLESGSPTEQDILLSYLSTCNTSVTELDFAHFSYLAAPDTITIPTPTDSIRYRIDTPLYTLEQAEHPTNNSGEQVTTFTACKYKRVAKKIHPILAELPDKFRITCNIIGDPLADMPILPSNPPDFQPTGRYTMEHRTLSTKCTLKVSYGQPNDG